MYRREFLCFSLPCYISTRWGYVRKGAILAHGTNDPDANVSHPPPPPPSASTHAMHFPENSLAKFAQHYKSTREKNFNTDSIYISAPQALKHVLDAKEKKKIYIQRRIKKKSCGINLTISFLSCFITIRGCIVISSLQWPKMHLLSHFVSTSLYDAWSFKLLDLARIYVLRARENLYPPIPVCVCIKEPWQIKNR